MLSFARWTWWYQSRWVQSQGCSEGCGDKAGAGAGAKAGDEASFDAYFDFEATDFSADSEDLADNKDVKAGTEDYDALLNEKINIAKASYENLSKDAKELKKT